MEETNDKLRPWGFLATSAITVLILFAFFAVQSGSVYIYLLNFYDPSSSDDFSADGLLFTIAVLASAPFGIGFVILASWLGSGRRGLKDVWKYLALGKVKPWVLARWLIGIMALIAALDVLTYIIGRPVVPDVMREAYATSVYPWLFAFAIVALAPIFEELLFRGFMMRGLISSWPGPFGAVVITSLLWTALHVQYDLFESTLVFILGLVLATARIKSGSTTVAIAMHGVANIIALVEIPLLYGF